MTYRLLVDDNFHYMGQSERYDSGRFATLEQAIAAAKSIVDSYLSDAHVPGMTADELFRSYTSFGEDPFVVAEGGARSDVLFSAWDYARQSCLEICAGTEEERARPTVASRRQEAASLCTGGDADAMARLGERLKGPGC